LLLWGNASHSLAIDTVPKDKTQNEGKIDATSEKGVFIEMRNETEVRNISDAIRISVKVINRQDSYIDIEKIVLRLPPALEGTRNYATLQQKLSQNPKTDVASVPPGEEPWRIDNNSSSIYYFDIPAAERRVGLTPNRRWLTFMPGEYDLRVEMTWRTDSTAGVTEGSGRIRLEPDALALMVGSALGSVLLAIFILSYRSTEKASITAWPMNNSIPPTIDWPCVVSGGSRFALAQGGQALTRVFSGVLISWILLLFLNYAHDVQIPVTIAVNDFFGAVLLGLFSHSLGKWVYEKLSGSSKTSEDQTKYETAEELKEEPKDEAETAQESSAALNPTPDDREEELTQQQTDLPTPRDPPDSSPSLPPR